MRPANCNSLAKNVDPARAAQADPDDLRALIQHVHACHLRCQKFLGEAVIDAFDAGHSLEAAKAQLKHGQWTTALERALAKSGSHVSARTCQRYMKLARKLLAVPACPALSYWESRSKATRASFLKFLTDGDLTSINGVLALDAPRKEDGSAGSETEAAPCSAADSSIAIEMSADCVGSDAHCLTPQSVVRSVIAFLGTIDLDPCGVDDRSLHLPATHTLTAEQDSLRPSVPWEGRIFVHPPHDNVMPFAERADAAVRANAATVALMLIPAVTDAPYMGPLQPYAKAFLRARPTFATPAGDFVQPATPYVLVFVSQDAEKRVAFAEAFGHFCDIYYPHLF